MAETKVGEPLTGGQTGGESPARIASDRRHGHYACKLPPGACHCPQDIRRLCEYGDWIEDPCPKCGGAGWVWWHELDAYDGPAVNGYLHDDTRYSCDDEWHKEPR